MNSASQHAAKEETWTTMLRDDHIQKIDLEIVEDNAKQLNATKLARYLQEHASL
jgi:hypothetical protein